MPICRARKARRDGNGATESHGGSLPPEMLEILDAGGIPAVLRSRSGAQSL